MIYLDNNATTQPSAAAVAAVNRGLVEFWHNPSSVHRPGQGVRAQVELARRDAAALVNAQPRQIVFTSGGTEALDMAIRGVTGRTSEPPVVVSSRVEHAAVRDLLEDLEKAGEIRVRWAPVDRRGLVVAAGLDEALAGARLAVFQWANNETGGVQPVREIGAACRRHGVIFACDAVQWVGKEPADVSDGFCDLLVFSPHKLHGPKGVGVLWVRRGLGLRPTIHGTQELGRRGGTENVPGILGAGAACKEAAEWLDDAEARRGQASLRDRFERLVLEGVPDAAVNGPAEPELRLWNTSNIGVPAVEAEALLLMLSEQGVCASAGAACSSGSLDPSPVLLAMGVPEIIAHGSLRFSLSRHTTAAEVERAAAVVVESVRRLRKSLDPAS